MNFNDYCYFNNKTQVFHFPPQDITVAGDKTVLQVIVTYFHPLVTSNLKLQKYDPSSKFPGFIMFLLGIITTLQASLQESTINYLSPNF